jgi:hypothetical protein
MYLLALEYHTSNVSQSASSPFFRKSKNRKEEIIMPSILDLFVESFVGGLGLLVVVLVILGVFREWRKGEKK